MKISQVLREAKPRLYNSRYVCYAIQNCDISIRYKRKAKKYIQDLIYPWSAVDIWLLNKGIPRKYITPKNMLAYRHRWIDHMVVELEKEGK